MLSNSNFIGCILRKSDLKVYLISYSMVKKLWARKQKFASECKTPVLNLEEVVSLANCNQRKCLNIEETYADENVLQNCI